VAGDHRDIADTLGHPPVTRPRSQSRLVPRDRHRHDGAEHHPPEMPAARHPGVGERRKGEYAGKRDDDPVPRRFRCHPGCRDKQNAAGDPRHSCKLPDQPDQGAQSRRLDGDAGEYSGFTDHPMDQRRRDRQQTRKLQQEISHRSLHTVLYGYAPLASACQYTGVWWNVAGTDMSDQLSARDWLDLGLKTLARDGFTALKAEPLAKAMRVSRGSFYWHFADIAAYHAAILKHWRDIAAERIIDDVEAASKDEDPLALLLRRVFGERLMLERAVRTWASVDPAARAAVQAIDRRRLNYVEGLLAQSGLAAELARARAQILYWAFLGFALSDQPLSKARQQAVLDELLRIAAS